MSAEDRKKIKVSLIKRFNRLQNNGNLREGNKLSSDMASAYAAIDAIDVDAKLREQEMDLRREELEIAKEELGLKKRELALKEEANDRRIGNKSEKSTGIVLKTR